ncbi:MAG: hypothetical protein KJ057_16580 [Phycisphaerae bacterium]|nr:hypothetical protein [Planctomycetia bacterium]MCK6466141.1 hypothetical protein [Phycisphaerae bacterium]MCL4720085.1 hypothetical protein [Phycisphaerae bacterium]NUQ09825.1 hypothetical protein [Phycisphaerae bacterium]
MISRRKWVLPGLGFVLLSGALLGASFTWTGNGGDDAWSTTANWFSAGCAFCFPDDTGDDALIPSGSWTVDLVDGAGDPDEEIDDLTIEGDVDFGVVSGSPTLKVDSLTIVGPVEVAMGGGAIVSSTLLSCDE